VSRRPRGLSKDATVLPTVLVCGAHAAARTLVVRVELHDAAAGRARLGRPQAVRAGRCVGQLRLHVLQVVCRTAPGRRPVRIEVG